MVTTSKFLNRCIEAGLSMADLEYVSIGMVLDMITSKSNEYEEDEKGVKVATQSDFDKF